jgi:hypothetical protein
VFRDLSSYAPVAGLAVDAQPAANVLPAWAAAQNAALIASKGGQAAFDATCRTGFINSVSVDSSSGSNINPGTATGVPGYHNVYVKTANGSVRGHAVIDTPAIVQGSLRLPDTPAIMPAVGPGDQANALGLMPASTAPAVAASAIIPSLDLTPFTNLLGTITTAVSGVTVDKVKPYLIIGVLALVAIMILPALFGGETHGTKRKRNIH